jgi:glutamyl-tRNA reductase
LHVALLGTSHHTAPVHLRERIAVSAAELPGLLADLRSGLPEFAILSTCNRTELYAAGESLPRLDAGLADAWARLLADRGAGDAAGGLYRYADVDAARHLMRVAAGLDAAALGETQVLGQVRAAYRAAQQAGTAAKALHALFSRALAAGKRVHRETALAQSAVSHASAVVELARKIFGDVRRRSALVIGAGETATLAATHLRAAGVADLSVANRTLQRAEALAARCGGRALPLADLAAAVGRADIVVSASSAPGYLLTAEVLRAARAGRAGEACLLVDMAVPRDVEPAAGRLPGVFLYNVDDLRQVVAANLRARAREAQRAERVVAQEAAGFGEWLMSLEVVPAIRALHDKVEAIRQQELRETLARLPGLSPRERQAIEAMSAAIAGKILSEPTLRLKELAAGPGARDAAAVLCALFRLEPEGSG